MERLYDLIIEQRELSEELSEEQVNQRLIAWFAGKQLLASV